MTIEISIYLTYLIQLTDINLARIIILAKLCAEFEYFNYREILPPPLIDLWHLHAQSGARFPASFPKRKSISAMCMCTAYGEVENFFFGTIKRMRTFASQYCKRGASLLPSLFACMCAAGTYLQHSP